MTKIGALERSTYTYTEWLNDLFPNFETCCCCHCRDGTAWVAVAGILGVWWLVPLSLYSMNLDFNDIDSYPWYPHEWTEAINAFDEHIYSWRSSLDLNFEKSSYDVIIFWIHLPIMIYAWLASILLMIAVVQESQTMVTIYLFTLGLVIFAIQIFIYVLIMIVYPVNYYVCATFLVIFAMGFYISMGVVNAYLIILNKRNTEIDKQLLLQGNNTS